MAHVRWAVIGAGGIARRRTIPEGIVPARNAKLVAVYSPTTGQAVAQEFGVRACRSEEELLAQDCDAVYIASPVDLHREQACRAAAAGKHVLCEKPLGLNVADAEAIVAACEAAGVKLGTALMMRFHACHQAAQQLIAAGRLGQPVLARAQLAGWYPPIAGAWRQDPARGGGGSLMDLGGHCIDLLEMLLGPVAQIACMTGRLVHDYTPEDTAAVLLRFRSGAVGFVDALFSTPGHSVDNRLEIYGSAGSLTTLGTLGQGDTGTLTLRLDAAESGGEQAPGAADHSIHAMAESLTPTPVNTYRAQIEAFSQAILDGTDSLVCGAVGLRSQRLLAACYEAARSGQSVAV